MTSSSIRRSQLFIASRKPDVMTSCRYHITYLNIMETQVRIYRENPIAWVEKPILRYLRKKYGKDKRLFVSLRGVYLALCEMDSDFTDTPITFFTETVGTYAGVSREVAGKCINLLIQDGLIAKTRVQD